MTDAGMALGDARGGAGRPSDTCRVSALCAAAAGVYPDWQGTATSVIEHEIWPRGSRRVGCGRRAMPEAIPTFVFASFLLFSCLLIAGELWPRRSHRLPWSQRWLPNLSLFGIETGITRVLAASGVIGFAAEIGGADASLLPVIKFPPLMAAIVTLLTLDVFLYFTHRLWHHVPWLWRIHAIHHSDAEFDTTTHYRHHPIDVVIQMAFQLVFVWCVGPDPVTLTGVLVAHHFSSLCNHSNIALPPGLERSLRRLWVTPDMHRIHHSVCRTENDRNFGNLLSCWDRIFHTYTAVPVGGQENFKVGLDDYLNPSTRTLWGQLTGPFRRYASSPVSSR